MARPAKPAETLVSRLSGCLLEVVTLTFRVADAALLLINLGRLEQRLAQSLV